MDAIRQFLDAILTEQGVYLLVVICSLATGGTTIIRRRHDKDGAHDIMASALHGVMLAVGLIIMLTPLAPRALYVLSHDVILLSLAGLSLVASSLENLFSRQGTAKAQKDGKIEAEK